jgi:hypothetical protein
MIMAKRTKPETVSIEQLFTEEALALSHLVEELETELLNTSWSDTRYYELKEEILRLSHTIEYLALRLEGYYEIAPNDE